MPSILFQPTLSRLVLALFMSYCVHSAAQQNTVDTVLPQIGQRGTTVQVWMKGARLQTAEEVLFYQAGIRCTKIEPLIEIPHPQNGTPMKVEPGEAIALTFEIAPDAELGEYFLRLRTREKLSELLTFWVTPFPVVEEQHAYMDSETAGNNTPERAQTVPLNCTVLGYHASVSPANDDDLYRVRLEIGQRCTAQILNARLGTHHGGGLTDMAIVVHSPSGNRVARADDSPLLGQDPVVSFAAAESGDYIVTVRQQMDSEESLRHYGLHLGDFRRPVVTYPLGGPAGEDVDFRVYYADGSTDYLTAKLPSTVGPYEAALIDLPAITRLPGPLPAPNRIKVAGFLDVFEQDGHHRPENAQAFDEDLPFAINGIIRKEGEKDWYRFPAKKGERYRVRAFARTLGSKLDPFIWIKPAAGNPSKRLYEADDSLWDGHDWEGHHYRHQVKDRLDPVFMFEPDEDGEYLLGIADTRREYGEDYIYRVEIQPHEDAVFSYLPAYPSQEEIRRDHIALNRGATMARTIAIQNGFGSRYDGPMRLEAIGLPDTITFTCPVFTKNDPIILTTFSTPADTPLGNGLCELVPRALQAGVKLGGAFAQTTAATDRRGGFAMVFNKTRKLAWAVLEEAPFDVRIEQPEIGLAKNAELELKVSVTRKAGFKGAIYLEMDWLPKGVTRQPPLIIQTDEEVGSYKLSASSQALAGTYDLSITAREYEGGDPRSGVGFHYIASPLIHIEVLDPYMEITLERAAIEQGKPGEMTGTIKHLRTFNGEATAKLLRLPNGVRLVKAPRIKAGDDTVTFPIEVSPDALTGQYKEIACDIAITDAGQEIHQQTGDGVLRVDPKRN